VFARTLDHHHCIAGSVDEMIDYAEQCTFQILRFETDEVIAIVLASLRRPEQLPIDENHLPGQSARAVAFVDTLEPRDPAIALLPRLQQLRFTDGAALVSCLQLPGPPFEQSLRRIGVRLHPQPAAHSVRRSQSTDFDEAGFAQPPTPGALRRSPCGTCSPGSSRGRTAARPWTASIRCARCRA
jgi:hypothetical protein